MKCEIKFSSPLKFSFPLTSCRGMISGDNNFFFGLLMSISDRIELINASTERFWHNWKYFGLPFGISSIFNYVTLLST